MPLSRSGRLARPVSLQACTLAIALLGVIVAVGAWLAATPAATAATLHTRYDFERPGYGGKDHTITDHFLMESGGQWHLFYTEPAGVNNPVCRIGHARSTDLIHWDERPTVISAGGAEWMATGTWAPHLLTQPGGGWILYFAGRNPLGSQSIGALTSPDLETWTLVAGNPLWMPPTWARGGTTGGAACRDGFVWSESGLYQMIYTTTTLRGYPAIGRATSPDLLTWSDAGPLLIDSTSTALNDLESPLFVFDNGRTELLYTRQRLRMQTATTSAGPWDVAEEITVDPLGGAAEKVRSGGTQLLTRVRFDECEGTTSLIVIDTVTASPDGYDIPGPGLPTGWASFDAGFDFGWTYGDPPAWRGDTPSNPQGHRWISSGESYREPADPTSTCTALPVESRTGALRSPRFTLLGDSLWCSVMGAASPDSAAIRLIDACTGQELERRTGPGSSALTPFAWSNAGRRGWPVHLELIDLLTRPGGVIGADAIRDSTVGTFNAPTPVAINQTAPAGGETLTPGQSYVIRWTSFSTAGVDSHVVYVSYDDFVTPPIRLQRRGANQFSWTWTVPNVLEFTARIRVVAYAKNGAHDCDTSLPFAIGATTDAPPADEVAVGQGIALAALGSPGPAPALEWSAPPGRAVRLELIDVRGRRVRTLVSGRPVGAGGRERATWDGIDDAGRRVAPGLYFAALDIEGGDRRTVRLVRLATP